MRAAMLMRWAAVVGWMGLCRGVELGLFVPLTQGAEGGAACEGLGYDAELEGCVLPLSFAAMVSMGLLAVQQFNERDGSLVPAFAELGACEVEIEPTLFDCSFSQQLTVRNTIKMISADGFDAADHGVIGPATSSSAVAQSLITGALDVPQISYWATSPELDRDQVYQRFMRTIPTDPDVARAICSFWRNTQEYSFAGMLYVNDGYGEGFKEAILEECTRLGMEQVFTYPYTQGDQASIAAQVTALAADDVFIYLVIAQPGDLPLIVEAADKFDMFQDSSWIVTDGSTSAELNQISAALRPKFNGTLRVASQGGSPKNEVWQKFADNFASFDARELLGYEQLPALWRDTYGSVFDQMEGLKDLSEVKDIGAFIFDAVATFGLQSCKYSTSEDVASIGFGTYFFNTIQQLSFQGLSGEVEFLRNGNRAQNSSSFVMGNVIYSDEEGAASQVVQVGEYNNGGWEINKELIRFNGGSITSPRDITVIVHDRHYSQIVKSIMYAMAAINISLAISAMIWTIINRKDNVVRAAQLPFLLTVALGLCTTSSSIIVFTIDDSSVPEEELFDLDKTSFASSACMASVSMYSIGFTLSFGALYIKMWRIRKLFNRKNVFRRVVVPTHVAAFVFFVLISVDLSILVSWTLINPLTFSRVIENEDQFNQIEESNGICRQSGSYVFLGLLIAFHVIVLMGGNYLGWLCRKINSTFAETKYLAIYMAGYVQVLIIAAPTLVIVSELPEIAMFIKGVVIFLNDLALILLLWVPKVLAVNYGFHDSSGQGGEFFTAPKTSEKASNRSHLDFQSSVEKTQVYTDTATFIPPSFRKPRDRSSAFASETTQQS